jgi:hypothetical protein
MSWLPRWVQSYLKKSDVITQGCDASPPTPHPPTQPPPSTGYLTQVASLSQGAEPLHGQLVTLHEALTDQAGELSKAKEEGKAVSVELKACDVCSHVFPLLFAPRDLGCLPEV